MVMLLCGVGIQRKLRFEGDIFGKEFAAFKGEIRNKEVKRVVRVLNTGYWYVSNLHGPIRHSPQKPSTKIEIMSAPY